MIASRQCFGNRIRVRRHIFPKELAEFRLFKDSFQNTPECTSLHKPVQVSAYGLAVRYIRKIGNNKNRTVRSRTNAVLDLFRITVCKKAMDLSLFLEGSQEKTSSYIMASQSILLFLHTAQNTHTAVHRTQFSVPNMDA